MKCDEARSRHWRRGVLRADRSDIHGRSGQRLQSRQCPPGRRQRGPVPHQSRRQIHQRRRGQVSHQSRRQIRIPGRRSEVPHQSRRQVRVSRRVRRIRQPPSRARTAIIPGMVSHSIPMAAGAITSIDAPWPRTAPIGGIATAGAAAFIRVCAAFRACAAALRLSCESCGASACVGPHFALKAMEKLTLPGGRRCRKPCAPLQ